MFSFIIKQNKIEVLEKKLRYYYIEWSKGAAMIDNDEYDMLKIELEKLDPDNKFLREIKMNVVLGALYDSYPRVIDIQIQQEIKDSIKIIAKMYDLNLAIPSG